MENSLLSRPMCWLEWTAAVFWPVVVIVVDGVSGNGTQLFAVTTQDLWREDEFVTATEAQRPHRTIDLTVKYFSQLKKKQQWWCPVMVGDSHCKSPQHDTSLRGELYGFWSSDLRRMSFVDIDIHTLAWLNRSRESGIFSLLPCGTR